MSENQKAKCSSSSETDKPLTFKPFASIAKGSGKDGKGRNKHPAMAAAEDRLNKRGA